MPGDRGSGRNRASATAADGAFARESRVGYAACSLGGTPPGPLPCGPTTSSATRTFEMANKPDPKKTAAPTPAAKPAGKPTAAPTPNKPGTTPKK